MASNTTPSPSLVIVKNKADSASLSIQSRMGMTVTEFMKRLRDPQTKPSSSSEYSKTTFIWPKHTEYEIYDPTSTVYQRDPNDSSWFLRFRALGCYHSLPIRSSEQNEIHSGPRTPPLQIQNDLNGQNVQSQPTLPSKHSVNGERWKSLLKSRSINPPPDFIPGSITADQHLQLEEDLQLSDSEEEQDQKDERPNADNLTSATVCQPVGISKPANSSPSLTKLHQDFSHPAPLNRVINECGRIPPPFVSPLSVMVDDGGDGDRDNDVARSDNETLLHTDPSNNNGRLSEPAAEEPVSHDSFQPSTEKKVADLKHEDQSLPQISTPPVLDHTAINMPSSALLSDPSEQVTSVPSPVTQRRYTNPRQLVNEQQPMRERTDVMPLNIIDSRRDYVKRLLAESAAVLTAKEQCLVTGLSPSLTEVSWKRNVATPDKENAIASKRDPCLPSPTNGERMRLTYVKHSPFAEVSQQKTKTMNQKQSLSDSKLPSVTKRDCLLGSKIVSVEASGKANADIPSPMDNKPEGPVLEESSADQHPGSHTTQVYISAGKEKQLEAHLFDSVTKDPSTRTRTDIGDKLSTDTSIPDALPRKLETVHETDQHDPPELDEANDNTVSDNLSMPPPEISSKKNKALSIHPQLTDSRSDSLQTVSSDPNVSIAPPSVSPCTRTDDSLATPLSQISSITPTEPKLRALPDKRWLFCDLPLTKVRSKIQSVVQKFSTKSSKDQQQLTEDIRATLASFASNREQLEESGTSHGRKTRARPLMGILLLPSGKYSSAPSLSPICDSQSTPLNQSTLVNASTMTSPLPVPQTISVGIQYACRSLDSSKTNEPNTVVDLVSEGASHSHKAIPSSPSATASIVETKLSEAQDIQLAIEEENRLLETTVDDLLHLAGECHSKAAQYWKSLVGVIAEAQSSTPGSDLHHFLLELEPLHQYPVQLLKGVQHLIGAVHLLERRGESERAAKHLNEAASQLDHINRRLRRVEAKLIKQRVRAEKQTDSSAIQTGDPSPRARRDAGWMHLWYYALSRIRSILNFKEYKLRMNIANTLHSEVEDALGALRLPSEEILDNKSESDASVRLSTATLLRVRRLLQLQSVVQQATLGWEEADKLATEVPAWIPNPDGPLEFHAEPQKLDGDIACSVGGPHLSGWQTRTGSLLRFMNGLIKVHETLVGHLKITHINPVSEISLPPTDPSVVEIAQLNGVSDPLVPSADTLLETKKANVSKERVRRKSKVSSPPSALVDQHLHPIAGSKEKMSDSPAFHPSERKKQKRGRKRQLVGSDDQKSWEDCTKPVDSPTPSTTTNTDVDTESVASSINTELAPSEPKLAKRKHNRKKSSMNGHSCQPDGQKKIRKMIDPDPIPQLTPPPPKTGPHHELVHTGSKLDTRSIDPSQGCVTSTPSNNDLILPEALSPEYPPSSPSPPRGRRRSKSLVPNFSNRFSVSKSVHSIGRKNIHSASNPPSHSSGESEDNAYQPKRIRVTDRTFSPADLSDCGSVESGSPLPPYRPSVTVQVESSYDRTKRCASVGRFHSSETKINLDRSANSTSSTSHNSTSDSMGYSPTKQLIVNGIREKSDNIPVYRVSRIERSPVENTHQPSEPLCASSASTSTGTAAHKVPSFYTRWKNVPPVAQPQLTQHWSKGYPPTHR